MGKLPGQKLDKDSRGIELDIDAQINNELQQSPIDTDKVLGLLSRSLADTREMLVAFIKDYLIRLNKEQQVS